MPKAPSHVVPAVCLGFLGSMVWLVLTITPLFANNEAGPPIIYGLDQVCAAVGTKVRLPGRNLNGGSIWFGERPARTFHEMTPDQGEQLFAFVPSGATTGPVTLRFGGGEVYPVRSSFEVVPITVGRAVLTQGVPGYPLIWRKQSLLQVFPEVGSGRSGGSGSPGGSGDSSGSGDSCEAAIDGGQAWVEGRANLPWVEGFAGLGTSPLLVEPDGSVEGRVGEAVNFSFPTEQLSFDLNQFKGFRYRLVRNSETVVEGVLDLNSTPPFHEAVAQPNSLRTLLFYYLPKSGSRAYAWERELYGGLANFLRTMPVSGDPAQHFPQIIWVPVEDPVRMDAGGLFAQIESMARMRRLVRAEASLPFTAAAGIIDQKALLHGGPSGLAYSCSTVGCRWPRYTLTAHWAIGHTLAQEVAHNFQVVGAGAVNAYAGDSGHSRYNEGRPDEPYRPCVPELTFGQALQDQMPEPPKWVVNLLDLSEYPAKATCTGAAKSIMSYVPGQSGSRAFFEYVDYMDLFGKLGATTGEQAGSAKGASLPSPVAAKGGPMFELVGRLSQDGTVSITHSQVSPVGEADMPDPQSTTELFFMDKNGQWLARHPFPVVDPQQFSWVPLDVSAALPPTTDAVEIRRNGLILYRLNRSATPPEVKITVASPTEVAWEAWDSDGDQQPLVADVLWSPNGLPPFYPVSVNLQGNRSEIDPRLLPGGNGLLRVVVSDGFHTATDQVSMQIEQKPPVPAILSPNFGEQVQRGLPYLHGLAYDLEDGWLFGKSLRWWSDRDGFLGTGGSLVVRLSPGEHLISLVSSDSNGSESKAQRRIQVKECYSRFVDLSDDDPACGAVAQLAARKVLAGDGDGSFGPNRPVTRAEVAKMVVLAVGVAPEPEEAVSFLDAVDHWVAEEGYLQTAVALGAVNGFVDGSFQPDEPVTRAQLVKIAAAAVNQLPGGSPPFADIVEGEWYSGWVAAAVWANLIGYHAQNPLWTEVDFRGERPATRAEAAMLLSNLLAIEW